ncbi:MAG: NAD-glutamate dehydrogenase domain-containing protein, partial [Gammaproteobacteria bacterium]
MKVFLTTGNFALKTNRQRHKLKAVQSLLDSEKTVEHRRFLIKLAEILLFPDSYFISLPPPMLASLITRIFGCVEQDTEVFTIHTLAFSNDDQQFIVINSRNLMYVVDSLLVLQENQEFPFQMLAHPVLSIKRQGKVITSLENNDSSGTKQLLIILRLEAVSEANKDRFLKRIEYILNWAYKL